MFQTNLKWYILNWIDVNLGISWSSASTRMYLIEKWGWGWGFFFQHIFRYGFGRTCEDCLHQYTCPTLIDLNTHAVRWTSDPTYSVIHKVSLAFVMYRDTQWAVFSTKKHFIWFLFSWNVRTGLLISNWKSWFLFFFGLTSDFGTER